MANLPETEDFADGTYQIETSDRVLGGPGGIANKQAEQLGNRTAWLRAAIAKIIDGTTAVGKATQLAAARTLKFKGAVSGSGSYDGTGDTEIALTLVDTGVAAGTYTKVTINVKGLVTGASNPATLAGYGITDAFTRLETTSAIQQAISSLVASSPAALDTLKELADALGNDPNYATTMTNALAGKAAKSTTLGGYGITDAFTKPETTSAIQQAIASLVDSSPAALDTLKELASALGNDPNFATTITNELSGKASLASPAFTGNPTAPTPAQFDNDVSLATTEYVRRALGNYVFAPLSANRTLVAADAGSCYDWLGTSNGTIKLPLASTLVAGAGFRFQNISAYTLTVQVQGTDELYLGSSSAGVTSVVLGPGDSLELVHDSVRWISIGGTAALKGAAVFGGTMATIGFQRLPSGLVEQWTLVTLGANGKGVVTYPQTLSVLYAVHPVGIYGGIYYGVSVDNTPGLSSCALIASAAVPINAYVRIIGKL